MGMTGQGPCRATCPWTAWPSSSMSTILLSPRSASGSIHYESCYVHLSHILFNMSHVRFTVCPILVYMSHILFTLTRLLEQSQHIAWQYQPLCLLSPAPALGQPTRVPHEQHVVFSIMDGTLFFRHVHCSSAPLGPAPGIGIHACDCAPAQVYCNAALSW